MLLHIINKFRSLRPILNSPIFKIPFIHVIVTFIVNIKNLLLLYNEISRKIIYIQACFIYYCFLYILLTFTQFFQPLINYIFLLPHRSKYGLRYIVPVHIFLHCSTPADNHIYLLSVKFHHRYKVSFDTLFHL